MILFFKSMTTEIYGHWKIIIDNNLYWLYLIGSSSNARFRKASKGRRNWNAEEEDVLLACLKELVATGWKSDNGFRPGYINKLTDMMRVHFPRANIKANPHMVSKLTGWKRNYGSLVGILNRSGVGFNVHGDFTVDADDQTWECACNVIPKLLFHYLVFSFIFMLLYYQEESVVFFSCLFEDSKIFFSFSPLHE